MVEIEMRRLDLEIGLAVAVSAWARAWLLVLVGVGIGAVPKMKNKQRWRRLEYDRVADPKKRKRGARRIGARSLNKLAFNFSVFISCFCRERRFHEFQGRKPGCFQDAITGTMNKLALYF
jgi:hypothetical protein